MRWTAPIALLLAALAVRSADALPVSPVKTQTSAEAASGNVRRTTHPARVSKAVAGKTGRGEAHKRHASAKQARALRGQRSRPHPIKEAQGKEVPDKEAPPGQPPVRNAPAEESQVCAGEAKAPARRLKAKTAIKTAPPPLLAGSHQSLERQNDKTEGDNLERIEDEDDLADRIARKMLVPVPASAMLTVNGDLPASHRYCRPWTARFLADLARLHGSRFHRPLEVSSAVRTVEYQKRLMETNGNAAAAEGDIVSPHLTGATVDIAKQGLSRQELAWMRTRLLSLQQAGKIDVEEEFHQACFHITVYKSYVPLNPDLKPDGNARQARAGQ
jgi:uncharacterized protein YcbK (DUF882 family)